MFLMVVQEQKFQGQGSLGRREYHFCAYCVGCLDMSRICASHSKTMRSPWGCFPLWIYFDGWGHGGSERRSDMPRVAQLGNSRVELEIYACLTVKPCSFSYTILPPIFGSIGWQIKRLVMKIPRSFFFWNNSQHRLVFGYYSTGLILVKYVIAMFLGEILNFLLLIKNGGQLSLFLEETYILYCLSFAVLQITPKFSVSREHLLPHSFYRSRVWAPCSWSSGSGPLTDGSHRVIQGCAIRRVG